MLATFYKPLIVIVHVHVKLDCSQCCLREYRLYHSIDERTDLGPAVDTGTYNDAVHAQLAEVSAQKKYHNFEELLETNDIWTVQ